MLVVRAIDPAWGFFGFMLSIIDCDVFTTYRVVGMPALVLVACAVLPRFSARIIAGYMLGLSFFVGTNMLTDGHQSCALSFLIGSVLAPQIFAHYLYGIDLHTIGSGGLGISNLHRTGVNKWIVGAACICEVGKGALASYLQGAHGLMWCILGHIVSPWSRTGRGGKGVAAYYGGLLHAVPIVGAATIILWATMTAYNRPRVCSDQLVLSADGDSNKYCASINSLCGVALSLVGLLATGNMSLVYLVCIATVACAHVEKSADLA